jgi:hypothetical protein
MYCTYLPTVSSVRFLLHSTGCNRLKSNYHALLHILIIYLSYFVLLVLCLYLSCTGTMQNIGIITVVKYRMHCHTPLLKHLAFFFFWEWLPKMAEMTAGFLNLIVFLAQRVLTVEVYPN